MPHTNTNTAYHTRDIYAGRTPDGSRVFVEFRLDGTPATAAKPGSGETVPIPKLDINHQPVPPGSPIFAITGHTYRKGANLETDDWDTGGQISSTLSTVRRRNMLYADGKNRPGNPAHKAATTPELTDAEIRFLASCWTDYHLNDMTAACAHQQADPFFRSEQELGNQYLPSSLHSYNVEYHPSTTLTYGCPLQYRWGSAWLYTPIPDAVWDRLTALAERFPRT